MKYNVLIKGMDRLYKDHTRSHGFVDGSQSMGSMGQENGWDVLVSFTIITPF